MTQPTNAELLQGLRDLIKGIEDAGIEDLEHDYFSCQGEDRDSCVMCKARDLISRAEKQEGETPTEGSDDVVAALANACDAALNLALPEGEQGPEHFPPTDTEWANLRKLLRGALARVQNRPVELEALNMAKQCNAADAMFSTLKRCEASLTVGSAATPEVRDVMLADIRKSLSVAGWQAP